MNKIIKELEEKLDYQKARYEVEENREVKRHLFGKFTGYEQALIDLHRIVEAEKGEK
mgnify:FL=1